MISKLITPSLKSFLRTNFITAVKYIRKNWWYLTLLMASTIYIIKYRYDVYQFTEFTAAHIIFVLWIVLLGVPIFSEIEIGSVKLKKEIEQARSEVKESIGDLRLQIMDMKITNSASVVVNYPPLPTKEELEKLEEQVEDTQENTLSDNFNIPDENIYLFKVRLSLENQLSKLCSILNFREQYRGSGSLMGKAHFLMKHEIISLNIYDLLREVISITNRGVHGELINEDYISFVKKVYPSLIKYLVEVSYREYKNQKYMNNPNE